MRRRELRFLPTFVTFQRITCVKTNKTIEGKPSAVTPSREMRQAWANRFAPTMFALSFAFLVLVATLIVVIVDMPRVEAMTSSTATASQLDQTQFSDPTGLANYFLIALLAVWLFFPAELAFKYFVRDRNKSFWWNRRVEVFAAICPPLRLALPNHAVDGKIWLPILGWKQSGKRLYRKLEKKFSTPMLVIALLILPVLLVEFGLQGYIDRNEWLRTTLHICTGLIWFAFTLEFIVMVSATDKRLGYVKKNWIDLAIILLPLLSFLRSLRVVRAARVARFAKVQQLAKMTRVYRMRGLFAKTLRALLLLEIANRILRITPEKKLAKLQAQFAERQEELTELKEQIDALKTKVANNQDKSKSKVDDESEPSPEATENENSKHAA